MPPKQSATLDPSVWKVGGEVWCSYFHLPINNYVAKLDGHIISVGADGFRYRRVRPRHDGVLIERCRFKESGHWPTREACEAWIRENPFTTEPQR